MRQIFQAWMLQKYHRIIFQNKTNHIPISDIKGYLVAHGTCFQITFFYYHRIYISHNNKHYIIQRYMRGLFNTLKYS